MPQEKIRALISDLHERFADDLVSPQQQALLQQLQAHMHEMDAAEPADPNFLDTADMLLAEIETDHPVAAGILRQAMELLKNMGI